MRKFLPRFIILLGPIIMVGGLSADAAEQRLLSPDDRIAIVVTDEGGMSYRVDVNSHPEIARSRLGLKFKDAVTLGAATTIDQVTRWECDASWQNPLGKRRTVRDHYREMHLALHEGNAADGHDFGLVVRAYDDGVAFRYELPESSKLDRFILTDELTEFVFAQDAACWSAAPSASSESPYVRTPLSQLPDLDNIPPLTVRTADGFLAVSEADLLDWAGLFIGGTHDGRPAAHVRLAGRKDRTGAVVSQTPRLSPWRVIMIGQTAGDLFASSLIENLATPNQLGDVSWVKPGITSWDPWWSGVHARVNDGKPGGGSERGNTAADEDYIDFSSEMGFAYQLIDWGWYNQSGDVTKPNGSVDIAHLVDYARQRHVRELLWMHSADLTKTGIEKTLAQAEAWGVAGVKIDFMDSSSQETVAWYMEVLQTAARHHLLVDFHGAYKPTGLARTFPNFITQEGVLGNEYNKFKAAVCRPSVYFNHTFTRALLGPMDFTPGGFVNVSEAAFATTAPAQVMGTRARQLAESVIFPSPLLCLCDSPANYRGQPGVEFFRGLPTVWDETLGLDFDVERHAVVARAAGGKWYLAAMNANDADTMRLPLRFLGPGNWILHDYADKPGPADPREIVEESRPVDATTVLPISLAAGGGGFVGILSRSP